MALWTDNFQDADGGIKHVRKRKLRQFKSKQQRGTVALFQKKLELQAKTQIDPKRPLNNLQFTKW